MIANVLDFGAVGDGVTDDTTAINLAIASLPSIGGLYFPAGTYAGTQHLGPHSGFVHISGREVHIFGDGVGLTTLTLLDTAPDETSVVFIAADGCSVSDLTVDGNRARLPLVVYDVLGEGINTDAADDIVIRNVDVVETLGDGIDIDAGSRVRVSGVRVSDCSGNGLMFSDLALDHCSVTDAVVRNCAHGRLAAGQSNVGAFMFRGNALSAANIEAVDCAIGLSMSGSSAGKRGMIVNGYVARGCDKSIYAYDGVSDATVSGFSIETSTAAQSDKAIEVTSGTSHVHLVGGAVRSTTVAGGVFAHISGDAHQIAMTSLVNDTTAGRAIEVQSDSIRVAIVGNTVNNYSTPIVTLVSTGSGSGTRHQVRGNTCWGHGNADGVKHYAQNSVIEGNSLSGNLRVGGTGNIVGNNRATVVGTTTGNFFSNNA